jgi:hypothetical protein
MRTIRGLAQAHGGGESAIALALFSGEHSVQNPGPLTDVFEFSARRAGFERQKKLNSD